MKDTGQQDNHGIILLDHLALLSGMTNDTWVPFYPEK